MTHLPLIRERRRTVVTSLAILAILVLLLVLEMQKSSPATTLHRLNSGGPQLATNPVWSPDTSYVSGGTATFSTTARINLGANLQKVPMALFQTERWGTTRSSPVTYKFPVSAGTYRVNLFFAEIWPGAFQPGIRQFNVDINGKRVLTNFDIYATVGANTGLERSFDVTTSSGLSIVLSHASGKNNPEISGMSIVKLDTTPTTSSTSTTPAPSVSTTSTTSTPAVPTNSGPFIVPLGAAVVSTSLSDANFVSTMKHYGFTSITADYEMKMPYLHPGVTTYRFSRADKVVNFAGANGMRMRGHTLVWHREIPRWIVGMTPEQTEAAVKSHIQTVVGRYRGRVQQWDVVNEALKADGTYRDSLWRQRLGPDYIEKAFRWAHEADPDAKLFYNEYGAEGSGAKSDAVYRMVQGLKAKGVPIHGVGLQMHADLHDPGTPAEIAANIARLRYLGVAVEITELDVRANHDLTAQAERYGDLTSACLDSGCSGITTWGLYDGKTRLSGQDPLLFDGYMKPKPAYWTLSGLLKR